MALGSKIVDLVGFHVVKNSEQRIAVAEIAVMEGNRRIRVPGIGKKMVDAPTVERGCPTHDTMNRIPLFKEQFSKIGAILASDAGDESALGCHEIQS